MNRRIELSDAAREKLGRFERELNPARPEAGPCSPRIIGYGEMSTVFTFGDEDLRGLAFKRMALFQEEAETDRYRKDYLEYNELLQEFGIDLPDYGCTALPDRRGRPVLYLFQETLDGRRILHKLLHVWSDRALHLLFERVLEFIDRVFQANRAGAPELELGFDGQLSNWALPRSSDAVPPEPERAADIDLLYLDTSTPLMRKAGQEQLDPELFLRVCPSSLVWIIRRFFLADVVSRYYDRREVIKDAIANLYKEGRPDLVPDLTERANRFLQERDPDATPITEPELRAYYREDAFIWRLFLAFRRLERFWRTQILRGEYRLILPGNIKR